MTDDNMNQMIQGAFDFSLEQQIKGRNRYNNDINNIITDDKSLLYKNELRHNDKLSSLQSKLEKTKENIVTSILLSRQYEKSIAMTKATEMSLRSYVSNKLNGNNNNFYDTNNNINDKTNFYWLIERLSGIPKGYGYYMDTEIQKYDDDALCKELSSFPSSFYENFNVDIFSKIAVATSSNHITAAEVIIIIISLLSSSHYYHYKGYCYV